MTIDDYEALYSLWKGIEGIGLSDADSRDNIKLYLARNPNMSFVGKAGPLLVGSILCGHDGRRGYIHHLAVKTEYRGKGIGGSLLDAGLSALSQAGIQKCHVFVFSTNDAGLVFWNSRGWSRRDDLLVFSQNLPIK
ncbi:MAG: GNAT family N-acetyltransferase [Spirochaetales bacterium]|nr:GNAT family N-acetyltransferase [Spirochaetales bacterium]